MVIRGNPQLAKADLLSCVRSASMTLSAEALTIFEETERFAYENNTDVHVWSYLAIVMGTNQQLRSVLARKGCDSRIATALLVEQARGGPQSGMDKYEFLDQQPYSHEWNRSGDSRSSVIDGAINACKRHKRTDISAMDVIDAIFLAHEATFPAIENITWADNDLHTEYNTLSHFLGHYDKSLDVRVSEIRYELGLSELSFAKLSPAQHAPLAVQSAVLALLADHPSYQQNCFLMMPFAATAAHNSIAAVVRSAMLDLGFNVLRADDYAYSEDLLHNVEAYIFGCRFGVAIFERIVSDEHNANVALEIGYMYGLGKPVCLLKEQTVKKLPSDLIGRLYNEFDGQQPETSITQAIQRWLRDRPWYRTLSRSKISDRD